MRVSYGIGLLAVSTALSGCVSNTLDSLSSLSTGCSTTSTSVNCTPSTSTSSSGGTTGTTTTNTTPPTNTNTGNTSGITTGDTTLALESNVPISTQSNPAVSQLSANPLLGAAANDTFTINTNTSSNGSWPIPKNMVYYAAGGTTSNLADTPGYAEYRYFQKGSYDEELQVWNWTDSYATQYRDVTNSGTAPVHQAWSFGGNYTPKADIDTLASSNTTATYHGSWTATAQTSNWVDSTSTNQLVSYNNNWRVKGTSSLQANFGTGAFTGTLHSTNWLAVAKDGSSIEDALHPSNGDPINTLDAVMLADVKLTGTITTSTVKNAHPNQINGTANMDTSTYGWITTAGSNPMYGGFFGTNANEVAGVFALDTAIPSPTKGNISINDDRRAFLSMSGMFHGTQP